MKVPRSENGLYIFPIRVNGKVLKSGKRMTKVLPAIVDTGSTDCACTYEVITTLQIKPIDHRMILNLDQQSPRFIYEAPVGFDGRGERVPIVRVKNIAGNCHFVLGMSVLSKCVIIQKDDHLDITWKKP